MRLRWSAVASVRMEAFFCTEPRQAYQSMFLCLLMYTISCVLCPARLFTLTNILKHDKTPKRCHSHMFRDTFAVELLLAGVPIDQVSLLLGHSSVKVTEKHYAPFVKARQEQLAQSARKAWETDEEPPSPKPQKQRQNQNGSRSSRDHTRLPASDDLTGNAQPAMDA